jgi:hypothetical protein
MKKQIKTVLVAIFGIIAISILLGCASKPSEPSGPEFGEPNSIQRLINAISARFPIPIAGNSLTFSFEGGWWRAKLNGKDFLAGVCIIEPTDEGAIIRLDQSWMYADTGKRVPITGEPIASWVKTSGPEIILEYKEGPPATLTKISKDDDDANVDE